MIANSVAYEGVDLQTRTCAIYHVDLPWTPADLEQRNGRAYRQGNQLTTLAIYYPFALRSMDGLRYDAIQGKAGWLADLIKSSKRETNNPGAQQDLTPEETLLMISRDKAKTQALLEQVKAKKEQERRELQAKNAAKILARANARFRDARAERDPVEAARLRGEGDALLVELQRVPEDAWPWAPWTARVRDLEYLIPTEGEAPVYEGLRVGKANKIYADRVDYFEFGRLFGGMIGMRPAGKEAWQVLMLEEVLDLGITADALQRGAQTWAEGEAQETELAVTTSLSRLLSSGLCTWEKLAWRGASDAWLTAWWPKVRDQFVQGLLRAYWNDEVYPIVIGGVLHLATRERLGEGELLPPTSDGFGQFVGLAPPTRLTFTELDEVAQAWWFRPFPRGYLTEARQAAAAAAAEREAAAQALAAAPAPADRQEPLASSPAQRQPELTAERQTPPVSGPSQRQPGLTAERQAPQERGSGDPQPALTAERQDPPTGDFTLDSTREEVLAALRAADPAAHALAERGNWARLLERGGPLAERAHAWARYHRQLPAQRRAAERLEVDAALRGLGLAAELQTAYLDQLATAFEHGGDMRAVLAEATAHAQQSGTHLLADMATLHQEFRLLGRRARLLRGLRESRRLGVSPRLRSRRHLRCGSAD